jgi:hypothetical protein
VRLLVDGLNLDVAADHQFLKSLWMPIAQKSKDPAKRTMRECGQALVFYLEYMGTKLCG